MNRRVQQRSSPPPGSDSAPTSRSAGGASLGDKRPIFSVMPPNMPTRLLTTPSRASVGRAGVDDWSRLSSSRPSFLWSCSPLVPFIQFLASASVSEGGGMAACARCALGALRAATAAERQVHLAPQAPSSLCRWGQIPTQLMLDRRTRADARPAPSMRTLRAWLRRQVHNASKDAHKSLTGVGASRSALRPKRSTMLEMTCCCLSSPPRRCVTASSRVDIPVIGRARATQPPTKPRTRTEERTRECRRSCHSSSESPACPPCGLWIEDP